MAEHDGLDTLLRESLGRIAEPGDPAGVADAIRSRLASGDTGAAAASSTAPGWSGGLRSLLPWLGAGAVAIVAGSVVGASGMLGAAGADGGGSAGAPLLLPDRVVSAGLCPGGAGAADLRAGERVLVIARSEDSEHVAVRSPEDRSALVWLPASVVTADDGQSPVDELPVLGCAEPSLTIASATPSPVESPVASPSPSPSPSTTATATPTPRPGRTAAPAPAPDPGPTTPAPEPAPPTPPPGPADTTAPLIASVSPDGARCAGLGGDTTIRVTVQASDDVGVRGVSLRWSGALSGSGEMTSTSGGWVLDVPTAFDTAGEVTFVAVARDQAANLSAERSASTTVTCLE